MKAYHITAPGARPEFKRLDLPPPGPGQARVKIAACALNFADLLMIEGRYQEMPEPPFALGMEMAGTVEALGRDTTGPPPGTRVAIYAGCGGLAEAGNFPVELLTPVPDAISTETAAAFQIAYGTAHLALAHRATLRPGERLVVTGAGGGAGLSAVEVGALMGAEVVAVARGHDKMEVARRAGAAHVLDSDRLDLRAEILSLGGADVVYDTVGGDLWEALFRAANPEARLMPIGFAGGSVPQIKANHLLVKNLTVIGLYWGAYLKFAPSTLTRSLAQVLKWLAEGKLTLHIGARYPFAEAGAALEALKSRSVAGKIVVTMD
ncbi:MAG: NADPH:quinone oxidoreductase family protein [Pseudomonadota bacterium]